MATFNQYEKRHITIAVAYLETMQNKDLSLVYGKKVWNRKRLK